MNLIKGIPAEIIMYSLTNGHFNAFVDEKYYFTLQENRVLMILLPEKHTVWFDCYDEETGIIM